MNFESQFCVFPQDTNYMRQDMIFGGKMLSEMDIAAHLATRRLLQNRCLPGDAVTVGVTSCSFFCPAYIGDIVHVKASVKKTFNKSILVEVVCFVESRDNSHPLKEMAKGEFYFCYMENNKPKIHGIKL